MRNGFLMRRAILLVAVLAAARLLAEPALAQPVLAPVPPTTASDPAAAAMAPAAAADPVLAARCRASPAAFGCANAANLAAMARPADLVSGRPLAPASGALEAAAIDRLLTDKVKDLRREGTGAGAGTSGGGQ